MKKKNLKKKSKKLFIVIQLFCMLCSSKKYAEYDAIHLNPQAIISTEINVNHEWLCALFFIILTFWIEVVFKWEINNAK